MAEATRVVALVALASLAAQAIAPGAGAVCPTDWVQCFQNKMSLQTAFHANPFGVVVLDVANATVSPNRSLVAKPGDAGNVTVEILHPADEQNATANVTISVASTGGISWLDPLNRTVSNLTGFRNETFNFTVALGAPVGPASVFVNITAGNVTAPVQLAFEVGGPSVVITPAPAPAPTPSSPTASTPGPVEIGVIIAAVVAVAVILVLRSKP